MSLTSKPPPRRNEVHLTRLAAVVSALALLLGSGGCMVRGSKYEARTREVDILRDAIAIANREKTVLEARIESLAHQLADGDERNAHLADKIREQEEAIRKLNEELASTRRNYEGTRITREQLVAELLEKEKATGKRIQELSMKAARHAAEEEKLRREADRRGAELAELKARLGSPGEADALRRERDILQGRVERLMEERRAEDRRLEERFVALAQHLEGMGVGIRTVTLGRTLRIIIPDEILVTGGSAELSDASRKAVLTVGRTAGEFPAASVILFAGTRGLTNALKTLLIRDGTVPENRIATTVREAGRGAELLLLVP
jgi:flagellar motor protein MotB